MLPYLTTSLGANMEEYGYVQTVVGIVQLFGGLVSGELPPPPRPFISTTSLALNSYHSRPTTLCSPHTPLQTLTHATGPL